MILLEGEQKIGLGVLIAPNMSVFWAIISVIFAYVFEIFILLNK